MASASKSTSYVTDSESVLYSTSTRRVYYPEQYAKVNNANSTLKPCNAYFIKGQCNEGHKYLKAIFCGREWCPDCGKRNSAVHKRRIARWYDKAFELKKFGYLVVTIPAELRPYFLGSHVNKHKRETAHYYLKKFRSYCKRKLERMNYSRGLIRYHWAGDCVKCKGHGCQDCEFTGAGKEFNPHLNIIIEESYLTPELFDQKFNQFKADLVQWFKRTFKKEVKGNLFYSYAGKPALRMHKLKYITRATWRFNNYDVIDIIKGFRTSSSWGKFDKKEITDKSGAENKHDIRELQSLENGICPICAGAIKWESELILKNTMLKMNLTDISAGYYLINDG